MRLGLTSCRVGRRLDYWNGGPFLIPLSVPVTKMGLDAYTRAVNRNETVFDV